MKTQNTVKGLHNCQKFFQLLLLCCFITHFSKIIRQIKENFIYFLIEIYFPDTLSYFLSPNQFWLSHNQFWLVMCIWPHITNQNSCVVTTVFTYSDVNMPIDQWESVYYPNYFIIMTRSAYHMLELAGWGGLFANGMLQFCQPESCFWPKRPRPSRNNGLVIRGSLSLNRNDAFHMQTGQSNFWLPRTSRAGICLRQRQVVFSSRDGMKSNINKI